MKNVLKAIALLALCTLFLSWNTFGEDTYAESLHGEVVMEVETGRVLYSKAQDTKLPMASTTKIMTALVVLEHCDINELVRVPKTAVGVEGSSIYLREGDERTVEELLFGLMLRSGNDAAVCLALHVAGSVEAFANLMNERAIEIGAKSTNFTNPHGLHDDGHYTTAYDLAKISCVAMKNDDFKRIVGTKSVKFEDRVYYNKNKMLSTYDGATGIKTGFTKRAGRCLVSSSERDGMEVVCVVLNCYDMWERSKALMTKAHSEYEMQDVFKDFEGIEVEVTGGVESSVEAIHDSAYNYPIKKDGSERVRLEVSEQKSLKAPVQIDTFAGKIDVYVDNHLIFSENLYTIKHVRKKSLLDWFKEIT